MSREFRIFPSGEMCKPCHAQRLATQIPMPLTKGGIECLQICHLSVICSRQTELAFRNVGVEFKVFTSCWMCFMLKHFVRLATQSCLCPSFSWL